MTEPNTTETSYVSPLLISIPYYEPFCSIRYLPFFLTSLSILYNLYRSISISWFFPLKSNITIIYQPINILYNIIYKNEFILIRNLGHFVTINVSIVYLAFSWCTKKIVILPYNFLLLTPKKTLLNSVLTHRLWFPLFFYQH